MSTAERIADATEAAIETVEEGAAAAIAAAQAETERAEELAEEIADAAMESERGRRIDALEKDVAECRANLEIAAAEIQTLSRQFSEALARLETLETKPPAVVVTETTLPNNSPQSQSILPNSAAGETTVTTVEQIDPASLPEPASDVEESPAAANLPRKRRRLL